MATIRPLERHDLKAATSLMRARLPGRTADEAFLSATLLDHPWADPELPSLVAEHDDGGLVGFIGAQARRVRLDDRELRGVCCSHLVVAEAPRGGAAGALLLAKLLAGEQDLTWSDSATEAVVRMWESYGGHADAARACDWMLVLRPVRWLATVARALARRDPIGRALLPVGALPFQAAGRRLVGRAHPGVDPEVASEPTSAAAIVENLAAFGRRLKLRLDYDAGYLEHVFAQIERTRGPLVRRMVRRGDVPIGWYAFLPSAGRVARALHIAARDRETDAVVGDLVAQARAGGNAVLAGRLEPHLAGPLSARLAAVGFARGPVVHTRLAEVDALLSTRHSLLTQLDGEWFVT